MVDRMKRIVGATSTEVAEKAGKQVLEELRTAIRNHGKATFVLAGGNTPRSVYRLLAREKRTFPWSKVTFLFGDERCVPPTHERSNYLMVSETLLRPLGIPADNIFRMEGELPPPEAAERYEQVVREHLPLNLVLLGLGTDGHTASLFPGSPVLAERERYVRPAQATDGEMRLTLTLHAFSQAECAMIVVTGREKAEALYQLVAPEVTDLKPGRQVLEMTPKPTLAFDRAAGAMLG